MTTLCFSFIDARVAAVRAHHVMSVAACPLAVSLQVRWSFIRHFASRRTVKLLLKL